MRRHARGEPSHEGVSPADDAQLSRPPRASAGTMPFRAGEGHYDARRGAAGYATLVATFGALSVPALVVVFTAESSATGHELALSTGLLAVGVFGSIVGAFSLAAIGAERDPTANLAPAIMYAAVPVATSVLAVLGAFEVLAAVYAPEAARPFLFIVCIGTVYGVTLTAMVIGDAPGPHPRTKTAAELDKWRATQWLRDRRGAYRATRAVIITAALPPIAVMVSRFAGFQIAPHL